MKIGKKQKIAFIPSRCYTSYASCSFKPGPVIGLQSDFWKSSTITKYKQKVGSMIKHNKYVIVCAAHFYSVYETRIQRRNECVIYETKKPGERLL